MIKTPETLVEAHYKTEILLRLINTLNYIKYDFLIKSVSCLILILPCASPGVIFKLSFVCTLARNDIKLNFPYYY